MKFLLSWKYTECSTIFISIHLIINILYMDPKIIVDGGHHFFMLLTFSEGKSFVIHFHVIKMKERVCAFVMYYRFLGFKVISFLLSSHISQNELSCNTILLLLTSNYKINYIVAYDSNPYILLFSFLQYKTAISNLIFCNI